MNPLLLLLGIFGAGMLGRSGSGDTTSAAQIVPETGDDTDKKDDVTETDGNDTPEAPVMPTPPAAEDDTPDAPQPAPMPPVAEDDTPDAPAPAPTPEAPEAPTQPSAGGNETPAAAITLTFSLVDTATSEVVGPYTGGPIGRDQSLIVETSEPVGSVAFTLNGELTQVESIVPYALWGDAEGDIYGGSWSAGDYEIGIQVFSDVGGQGDLLTEDTLNVTVIDTEFLPGTGGNVDETPEPEPAPEPEPEPEPQPEPDPQPEPEPQPAPSPTPVGPEAPTNEAQDGTESDGGATGGTDASSSMSVMTGRVTTINPEGDNIASVEILSGVEHGKVTVNPDNTMALVLTRTDFTGNQNFTYEVTYANGSTSTHQVNLDVTPGAQADGWATGEMHYMLETDANDRIIVEAGENHTTVYVSGSNQALSRSDIAQMEGISTNQVTGAFLAENGYGQSEALALDEDMAMTLWNHVTPAGSSTSNHFLFERGYDYDISRVVTNDATGESENHPILIGAWGNGDMPVINNQFILHTNYQTENVVIQDLYFDQGLNLARMDNIIVDGVVAANQTSNISDGEGITIRNSAFIDASDGDGRTSGLFMGWDSDGVLLEGNFFDHNGWTPDWENGTGEAPTMFSHNLYIQDTVDDVTLRDTFIMRAAGQGVQVRPGGFIEDNVFIDNQTQLSVHGGDFHGGGPVGFYSLIADNLVTSAGHKIAENIGAYSTGLWDVSAMTSYVDNIVAHLADPNGNEYWKIYNNGARSFEEETFYDDTIVYNWEPFDDSASWSAYSPDRNVEGLDTDILDQTTIQIFTALLLGQQTATIDDLGTYLRAQYAQEIDGDVDTDDVIAFFQNSFGIAPDDRTAAADVSFVPNELGEGIRWDNRLNWDTGDLAGTNTGDNVDLRGNDVVFGHNAEINDLDLGDEGWLNVYGGRLDVNGGIEGENAELNIEGAGQIWINGSGETGSDIDVTASGGRFANTGDMGGLDLYVSGQTDAILATDNGWYEVGAGNILSLTGSADVGFDDDDGDMAILDFDEGSTLALSVEDGQLGEIAEFHSGAFGDGAPNVQSGIDIGGATLNIDLAGLSSSAGNTLSLMSADELVGLFDDATVSGLGGRNATILVDYTNDTVTLQLSSGNGQVSVETVGQEDDVSSGADALWQALTADQGVVSETLSAGVETAEQTDEILDAA